MPSWNRVLSLQPMGRRASHMCSSRSSIDLSGDGFRQWSGAIALLEHSVSRFKFILFLYFLDPFLLGNFILLFLVILYWVVNWQGLYVVCSWDLISYLDTEKSGLIFQQLKPSFTCLGQAKLTFCLVCTAFRLQSQLNLYSPDYPLLIFSFL